MKPVSALGGGFAGAIILTLIHETVRRFTPVAPRMDLLGMEAITKTLDHVEARVPEEGKLFKITMGADIISNSWYYSLAGFGEARGAIVRGAILGLAAGIGAVYLSKPLGLHPGPASRTLQTKLLTTAFYLAGGLIAGVVGKAIEEKG